MAVMKIIILVLSFATITYSQQFTFQKVFGGMGSDWGTSVIQASDGGYVIAGYSDSYSIQNNFYLIKTNSDGDTIWTKSFGSISEDYCYSLQETMDGGYVITGATKNNITKNDLILIKTNSDGVIQWAKTILDSNYENGYSIKQISDGNFIIAGSITYLTGGDSDVLLVKTDSDGDTLWTRVYGGTNTEIGNSIDITLDGGYIIAGNYFEISSATYDVLLIRTDSNGDTIWTKKYGGSNDDKGNSVCSTTDGGFIITGLTQSFGSAPGSAYLIKTASNGDTVWTKAIANVNSSGAVARSVRQTYDGGYVLAGQHGYSGQWADLYIVKTNLNGDTSWTKTYGGTKYEGAYCIQQTKDSGYVVVGLTDSYGSLYQNIFLLKTDSLGNSIDYDNGIFNYEEAKKEIKIYPNPFNTQANLILPPEIDVSDKPLLRVYDIYGNETARVTITSHRALITRDNLASGLYFCEAVKGNTVIATGKFIIQ